MADRRDAYVRARVPARGSAFATAEETEEELCRRFTLVVRGLFLVGWSTDKKGMDAGCCWAVRRQAWSERKACCGRVSSLDHHLLGHTA